MTLTIFPRLRGGIGRAIVRFRRGTRSQHAGACAVLLAGAFLASAGCRTADNALAIESASLVDILIEDLEINKTAVAQVRDDLGDILNGGAVDERKAFDAFSRAKVATTASWKAVEKRIFALRDETDRYLVEWSRDNASIHDDEIRQLARDQRADVNAELALLRAEFEDAGAAMHGYISQIDELYQALRNDLSPAGIRSVRGFILEATERSGQALEALDELQSQARSVSQILAVETR